MLYIIALTPISEFFEYSFLVLFLVVFRKQPHTLSLFLCLQYNRISVYSQSQFCKKGHLRDDGGEQCTNIKLVSLSLVLVTLGEMNKKNNGDNYSQLFCDLMGFQLF